MLCKGTCICQFLLIFSLNEHGYLFRIFRDSHFKWHAMKYPLIDPSFFIQNRQNLSKLLIPNTFAVFNSNDLMPRNGDQFFPFRQNSDLFWLCGIEQENTHLILFPNHPEQERRQILFIEKPDPEVERWSGIKLTREKAHAISGIETIYYIDEFEEYISEFINKTSGIYINRISQEKFSTPVPYNDIRFKKSIEKKYPHANILDVSPLVRQLRLVKSETEIDLIKKACLITEKAFYRLLNTLKPGLKEYEAEAEISYEFQINGVNNHAYPPIVASGKNALILHYIENENTCNDGDLLLLDFGAEYANYAADLSRTIPVNGRFNQRQKECYEAVLDVWKKLQKEYVVGTTINQINQTAGILMEEKMIQLGLLNASDVALEDKENPLYKKYFMHGAAHFIGLDVHDVGTKDIPLEEGMILSCEPGLYIDEENIGIRIETDLLITKDGAIDLFENCPVECNDIEQLMGCASGQC